MHHVTISGIEAELCWGYHVAAQLGKWSMSADLSGGDLTAAVVSVDPFRLSQPSLMFRVSRNGRFWCWPIVELNIEADALSARVGPQQES